MRGIILISLLIFAFGIGFANSQETTEPEEPKKSDELKHLYIGTFAEYPYDFLNADMQAVDSKELYTENGFYITKNVITKTKTPEKKEETDLTTTDTTDDTTNEDAGELTVPPENGNFYDIVIGKDGLIKQISFWERKEGEIRPVRSYVENFDGVKYFSIDFEYGQGQQLTKKIFKTKGRDTIAYYVYSQDDKGRINKIEKYYKKKFLTEDDTERHELRKSVSFEYDGDTNNVNAIYTTDANANVLEAYLLGQTTASATETTDTTTEDTALTTTDDTAETKATSDKKLITDNRRDYVGYIEIPIWFVNRYIKYQDGTKIEVKDEPTNYFYVLEFKYDDKQDKMIKELYYQDDLSPMNFRKTSFEEKKKEETKDNDTLLGN